MHFKLLNFMDYLVCSKGFILALRQLLVMVMMLVSLRCRRNLTCVTVRHQLTTAYSFASCSWHKIPILLLQIAQLLLLRLVSIASSVVVGYLAFRYYDLFTAVAGYLHVWSLFLDVLHEQRVSCIAWWSAVNLVCIVLQLTLASDK